MVPSGAAKQILSYLLTTMEIWIDDKLHKRKRGKTGKRKQTNTHTHTHAHTEGDTEIRGPHAHKAEKDNRKGRISRMKIQIQTSVTRHLQPGE